MAFYNLFCLVAIIKLTRSETITTSPAILPDCDFVSHYFNCGDDQYITIIDSTYMKEDTQAVCPYDIYTGNQHSQDLTSHVVSRCDGQECYITSPCAIFGDPCYGYTKQLVVNFECENSSAWAEAGGIEITQGNSSLTILDTDTSTYHYYCTGAAIVKITQAIYGRIDESSNCVLGWGSIDVTAEIQENYCTTHSCVFEALNDKFGEPCLRYPKQLALNFQCEDQSGRFTVTGQALTPAESNLEGYLEDGAVGIGPLGVSIAIPDLDRNYHYFYCPPTYSLKVTSATYGNPIAECDPDANNTLETGVMNTTGVMDATAQVQAGCSGRFCKVQSPDAAYGDPCVGAPKNLTSSFTCLLDSTSAGIGTTTTVTVSDTDSDWNYYYCPQGEVVTVIYAMNGNSTANCTANSNMETLHGCMYATSEIQARCSGSECYFRAPNGAYGDPCVGHNKQLTVMLECTPELGQSLQTIPATSSPFFIFRGDPTTYHYSCPVGTLIEISSAEILYNTTTGIVPCPAVNVTNTLVSSCYAADCYISFQSTNLIETADCTQQIAQLMIQFNDCTPA